MYVRSADFSSERAPSVPHTVRNVHVRFLPFFAFAFPFSVLVLFRFTLGPPSWRGDGVSCRRCGPTVRSILYILYSLQTFLRYIELLYVRKNIAWDPSFGGGRHPGWMSDNETAARTLFVPHASSALFRKLRRHRRRAAHNNIRSFASSCVRRRNVAEIDAWIEFHPGQVDILSP